MRILLVYFVRSDVVDGVYFGWSCCLMSDYFVILLISEKGVNMVCFGFNLNFKLFCFKKEMICDILMDLV